MGFGERENRAGLRIHGVKAAARYVGVSVKVFRDRIMPYAPVLMLSAPNAQRQRRAYSEAILDETVRNLHRKAV